MSTAKFEKLIDLLINEDQERAEQLFHEIVVEKSREIYESMMEEEMDEGMDMEEDDMSGDLMAEVEHDEMAMEDDEEMDMEIDDEDGFGDEEDMDMDDEDDMDDMDMGDEGDEIEDLENRVVDLEDKLDELMAEFEEEMGKGEGDEDMGMDGEEEGEEEGVMEAIQLKKVQGLYDNKIGGDDGAQTKSVVSKGPKVGGNGAGAVKFAQGDEKGRTAPAVKTSGTAYKNTPAKDNFSDKGDKAPAPMKAQASGVNAKSVVATEGRRSTKRRI